MPGCNVLALLLSSALPAAAQGFSADAEFFRDVSMIHAALAQKIKKSTVVRKAKGELAKEDAFARVMSNLEGSEVPESFVKTVFDDPRTRVLPEVLAKFEDPAIQRSPDEYQRIIAERIRLGAEFYKANEPLLLSVKARFGVDPFLVTALVGVETFYGERAKRFPVFGALYTRFMSFPKRADFAAREMAELLKICRREGTDPHSIWGSYAGAFGFAQFMPSSFNAYAVDFDENGHRAYDSWPDVLASVANYLRENGYKPGGAFSHGTSNWRAVYAYNHSNGYIREVLKLRRDILKALGLPDPSVKPAASPKPKTSRPQKNIKHD
ncbi:MAG: lytic murein transglycosylase [Elusimicrobiota bacterium]|jgi:membrane-bound lytic murein transglycosylase B